MHEYPLAGLASATSRSLSTKRVNRVRLSWFLLGLVSGVAVTAAVASQYRPEGDAIATQSEAASTAETAVAENALEQTLPMSVQLEVRPGDTLLNMLTDSNVAYNEAHNVVQAIKKIYNPRDLNVGQNLSLSLDKSQAGLPEPQVESLDIAVSPLKTIKLTRGPNGEFKVSEVEAPLVKKMARSGGVITSSLYETGLGAGISPRALNDIITAFSYDVDFQRDIKDGDKIDVLYERYETENGVTAGSGNIIYAELNLGGKPIRIYRYKDKSGNSDFYNELGESIRKALLKTPINGARLTSRFGMRRHPILGYSKMHKGVDFAAPTGTPIYAAGDGTVAFAGRKGGYGNYLQLKHNNTYKTAYAHLSRFASGMKPGRRVKQGDVIAYVGSTGASTGPHLHYEILAGSKQVNPSGVKFKTGNKLAGKELANFKTAAIDQVKTTLATLPMGNKIQVAMVAGETPAGNRN